MRVAVAVGLSPARGVLVFVLLFVGSSLISWLVCWCSGCFSGMGLLFLRLFSAGAGLGRERLGRLNRTIIPRCMVLACICCTYLDVLLGIDWVERFVVGVVVVVPGRCKHVRMSRVFCSAHILRKEEEIWLGLRHGYLITWDR